MSRGQTGEATLIVLFIVLNGIVVWGIVWGVGAYYSSQYDGRLNEATTLANKIQDCVSQNDFFSESFNFSRDCSVNADVLSRDHLVYVLAEDGREFILGTTDFKNQCFFKGGNKAYPVCAQRIGFSGGQSMVIIAGTNQKIRGLNT